MKQFIVLMAALPLLLVFLVQFTAQQEYSLKVAAVDDAVYTAKEMAKQEGCFTEKIQNWLKREICSKIKELKPSDIIIGKKTDTRPVYRIGSGGDGSDGLIHYQVSVPIRGADAAGSLLGIRESGKTKYYVIDSYAPSELLPKAEKQR